MPVLKNARWEAFARRRVMAVSHPESVKDSMRAIAPHISEGSVKNSARDLPKRPEIIRRVQELMDAHDLQLAKVAASAPNALRTLRDISLPEFIDWLSQAILTPVGMVDEMSPLAQEVTYESSGRKKVKMIGKSEAAALLAKVKGWATESAMSITFPGFVATVRNVGPDQARFSAAPDCPPAAQEPAIIEAECNLPDISPPNPCDLPEGQETAKETIKEG